MFEPVRALYIYPIYPVSIIKSYLFNPSIPITYYTKRSFFGKIPIKKAKYDDLQKLKEFCMNPLAKAYYTSLKKEKK